MKYNPFLPDDDLKLASHYDYVPEVNKSSKKINFKKKK
jgi:hypothetical protein